MEAEGGSSQASGSARVEARFGEGSEKGLYDNRGPPEFMDLATANALDALPRSCTSTTRLQDVQGRHRGEMVQRAASLVRRPTMKRWPLAARRDKRRDRCEVPCEALASGSKA